MCRRSASQSPGRASSSRWRFCFCFVYRARRQMFVLFRGRFFILSFTFTALYVRIINMDVAIRHRFAAVAGRCITQRVTNKNGSRFEWPHESGSSPSFPLPCSLFLVPCSLFRRRPAEIRPAAGSTLTINKCAAMRRLTFIINKCLASRCFIKKRE